MSGKAVGGEVWWGREEGSWTFDATTTRLVGLIRENRRDMALGDAVDAAVARCVEEGVLAEYLTRRKAEVTTMFMTEYDEERTREAFRVEGREEGREEGLALSIARMMDALHYSAQQAMDVLGIPADQRARYLTLL